MAVCGDNLPSRVAHSKALLLGGVEIDPRIADGPRSVILEHVEAGVAVRVAVLERLIARDDAERGMAASRPAKTS